MVHTNWDNLLMKWSGSKRWWDVSDDWTGFVKTAEELCKITLERRGQKEERFFLDWKREEVQNKDEEERKKNKMKEKEKQRIWDPAWGNQMRIQIMGDSNLIVNWMNGKWKINNQKFRMMVYNEINWSYDVEAHARKCVERYFELANKKTEQFHKVSSPCLDDHQIKKEDSENTGELSQVCSHILEMLVLGQNGSTRHSLISQ